MINPGYDAVLQICKSDLSATGLVAVVDFHQSRWDWFRRWIGVNHVRMEGQVLDELRRHFQPCVCEVHRGYGGRWRYKLSSASKMRGISRRTIYKTGPPVRIGDPAAPGENPKLRKLLWHGAG
ncbi:MAG: hypothetical protein WCP45_07895 [Verrucomicrobiota bacterium]